MNHRPTCPRPEPTTQPSRAIPGLVVARCPNCGAVELVKEVK